MLPKFSGFPIGRKASQRSRADCYYYYQNNFGFAELRYRKCELYHTFQRLCFHVQLSSIGLFSLVGKLLLLRIGDMYSIDKAGSNGIAQAPKLCEDSGRLPA